jgi:PHD/YefM family antitoxin component YafN of YafNO toxin-antitoxin module
MGSQVKTLADSVKSLSRVPASDVKRRGWRGIMRTLGEERAVVVTNHEQAEAVILAVHEYADLLERANQTQTRIEADLALLRRRFDERLAVLRKPDAGARLRSVMRGPARLRGKVKAGSSF